MKILSKFEQVLRQHVKIYEDNTKHYDNAIEESAGNNNQALLDELHRQRSINVECKGYTEMILKKIEDSRR